MGNLPFFLGDRVFVWCSGCKLLLPRNLLRSLLIANACSLGHRNKKLSSWTSKKPTLRDWSIWCMTNTSSQNCSLLMRVQSVIPCGSIYTWPNFAFFNHLAHRRTHAPSFTCNMHARPRTLMGLTRDSICNQQTNKSTAWAEAQLVCQPTRIVTQSYPVCQHTTCPFQTLLPMNVCVCLSSDLT